MGPVVESKTDINDATFPAVSEGFQEIICAPVKHGCVRHQAAERDQNRDGLPRE